MKTKTMKKLTKTQAKLVMDVYNNYQIGKINQEKLDKAFDIVNDGQGVPINLNSKIRAITTFVFVNNELMTTLINKQSEPNDKKSVSKNYATKAGVKKTKTKKK